MNKDIVSFEGEEKRDGIISMTGCTGISRTETCECVCACSMKCVQTL